jgi:hypothetical protein
MTGYLADFTDLGSQQHVHAQFDAADMASLARQVRAFCAHTLHCGCAEVVVALAGTGSPDLLAGTARLTGTAADATVAHFTVTAVGDSPAPTWPGYDGSGA